MTVFQQLLDLRKTQPRLALLQVNCENSDYVNYSGNTKNCYMLIGSEYDQDCYYGYFLYDSRDCVDCDYCFNAELCYDCVDCHDCYNCIGSQDCRSSRDLEYCHDMMGCRDCFGCAGLRHKEFYVFNEPCDRETYRKRVEELRLLPKEEIGARVEALKRTVPRLFWHGQNNERSFGDYLYQVKNSYYCFDVKKLEDCGYLNNSEDVKDSYDCSNTYYNSELNYQVMSAMNITNCHFCYGVFDSYDLEYSENVYGSHHMWGCFGLKGKSFHIFNEPYSEAKWHEKVSALRGQMIHEGDYGRLLPTTYPELIF